MISFATETVTVYLPVGLGGRTEGQERTVDIQPMSSAMAWEQFGVEVKAAYVLFDDPAYAAYYQEAGEINWKGKTYVIKAVPAVWNALPQASNVCVLLEEQN